MVGGEESAMGGLGQGINMTERCWWQGRLGCLPREGDCLGCWKVCRWMVRLLRVWAAATEGQREGRERGPGVSPRGSCDGPPWAPSEQGGNMAWRELEALGQGEQRGSQGQQQQPWLHTIGPSSLDPLPDPWATQGPTWGLEASRVCPLAMSLLLRNLEEKRFALKQTHVLGHRM